MLQAQRQSPVSNQKQSTAVQQVLEAAYFVTTVTRKLHVTCARAGKGRGLVAQGGIIPGDLLLVSQPVGQVVCGPEGMDLRPEQLVAHLQAEGALSNADR